MSVIKVNLPVGEIPVMGKQVSFKAPCDCKAAEAIQIDGVNYIVCDAMGRCVTGIGGVWNVGEIVSVILDTTQKKAFIQNGATLPQYNEHWWAIQHGVGGSGYREVKTPISRNYILHATSDIYGMGGTFIKQYASEVEFDADGNPTLKNPTNWTRSAPQSYDECEAYAKAILALAPCYISVENFPDTNLVIMYIPENATCTNRSGNGTIDWYNYPLDNDMDGYEETEGYQVNIQGGSIPVPALSVTGEYYEIPPGEIVYEHSTDRNAYPDSGIVDDTAYEYLGVPFEKLPVAARCETGSYTGTGTVGRENKNSLTFGFKPKMVIVSEKSYSTVGGAFYESFTWVDGMTSIVGPVGSYGNHTRYYTQTENGLSWYAETSTGSTARMQLNENGVEYRYIAIG